MNDNLQPLPDEHLEARITAYVLGEASPFEAAEIESLIESSPELKLFATRTRTLHKLLAEAETSVNEPDEEWKLHPGKRFKIARAFGENPEIPRLQPTERRIRRAGVRAAWGIAAVFVITLFTLRFLPWESGYEAEAVIEIRPSRSLAPFSGNNNSPQMTPMFFGTEFEKIKSRNTLKKVIDKLDLATKWQVDEETALRRLRDSIETTNIRGTDLVSVKVRQPDETDAMNITNEVVQSYRDYRSELASKSLEKGVNELQRAIREQEDKVDETSKVLATISRTKGLPYQEAGLSGGRIGRDKQTEARAAFAQYTQLENEKARLEAQVDNLLNFDDEQLMTYSSGLDLPDNAVKELYPRKLELKRKIDELKASGLAENHPTIKSNEKALDAVTNDLNEGVVNLRGRLQSQLRLTKDSLAKAEVIKPETKREALERGIDTQDYADAKRDFETEQALLEQMRLKLLSAQVSDEISEDTVIVHDDPAITRKGFSSNPLAALKKAITPEKNSSAPPARQEMALAEPSGDFGDAKDFGTGWNESQEPAAPASSPRPESAPLLRTAQANSSVVKNEVVHIGGQVRTPGPQVFKEGVSLQEAIVKAGGATEFGSSKRVKLYRDGKVQTYDITDERLAQIDLQPDDTIEMPQKNWLGCGASRDEVTKASANEPAAPSEPEYSGPLGGEIVTEGLRSGDQAISRNNIDAILNNPDRTAGSDGDTVGAAPLSITGIAGDELKDAEGMSNLAQREIIRRMESDPMAAPVDPSEGRSDLADNHDSYGLARAGKKLDSRFFEEVASLADQIPNNSALPDQHTQNVDQVRRHLYMGQGNYDLGKFDEAKKNYEDSLRIDPYNKAARRGMEKIAAAKSDYYRAAYDHTRSELLMQVDDAWELEVPAEGPSPDLSPSPEGKSTDQDARAELLAEVEKAWELAVPAEDQGLAFFDGFTNHGAPIDGESKQIHLTTKHVEISQANDKELGFDWITSPFSERANLTTDTGFAFPVTPATPTAFESRNAEIPLLGDIPITGRLFQEKQPADLADLSQEIPAAREPFSTFSLNISDASFQLALAAVEKGERPDPASIKPEQFYNAVDYGDPAPSSQEPVAAAIDQTAHPVIPGRNLVRIAVRTASTGRSAAQPLRLTLLVDQSGSMVRTDRRAAMQTALEQLATLLTENDEVTVIGFSRTPRLLADSMKGNEAEKLPAIINQTASEGGTNLEQAIDLASELALRHKLEGAQNRIVLFTDGAANLGNADPERLSETIAALRQQGLAFDIAGIGTNDLNDRLLAELARHGNGRYYLVNKNTGASLARQLAGAFRPAAENVKIQVKLNPERVGNYKLIGFEKDRLKTEDFRNDSVDAAELAADEAGVAMYQIEPLPQGTGEIGEVSVRFRDTASGEMVERSWTIPYDPTAPAFDKAAPQTQLATLALLAAQKLQPGPLADAIDFKKFAETTARLKQTHANDPKALRMLTFIDALK